MTHQYAVGVDIGGTNMVAGVIDAENGAVIRRRDVPTESQRGQEDGLNRIGALIEDVIHQAGIDRAQIVGIGIGATGPVDSIKGTVHNPFTLPGWDGLPLIEYIDRRFRLPSYLLGDCDVAALGEFWTGAGKGTRKMVYVTVGTGIGGGIVLDGRLYRGAALASSELGHHMIDLNGPECYCGGRGCWEALAAGPAIARRAAEKVPQDSLLLNLADGDPTRITAALVAEAARLGDPFAQHIMDQTAYYYGVGIGNLLNVLVPEVVIMGGGVMKSFDVFLPTIRATIQKRAAMIPFDQMRIVPAGLGLNAGITGAARAILDVLAGRL